jgi:5'-nucleotidase
VEGGLRYRRRVAHEQLELPLSGVLRGPEPTRIPRARRVFVNRNLRLTHVDWIGFDMDYTLAIYRQEALDRLSLEATIPKLVARGYPADLVSQSSYPLDFPIRGLLVDKKLGNVLKMDRFKVVQRGYHGLRELSRDELRALYHQRRLRPGTPRYHYIDTLYALSEATLYASLVAAFDKAAREVDYHQLFTDIRQCIDEAHADGTILRAIESDLPAYLDRDELLASTLHKFRSAGKRLFLLTNSRWSYTEKVMTHLLGDALPEYPSFLHYFDVVVAEAKKPLFFTDRRPLLQRVGGKVEPAHGPLERGVVYEGGHLAEFERLLGTAGDRVLYVGDHIYGDILRSKKESAWRTAMIIQEMEAEVDAHEACREDFERIEELEEQREEIEEQLRFYQQRFKDLTRSIDELASESRPRPFDGSSSRGRDLRALRDHVPRERLPELTALESERLLVKRAVERIRGTMRALDAQAGELERRIGGRFHRYWGSLLKEGHEKSGFGDQVEEYACLYTSRVSNLVNYSPLQHFRSPRDLLPHEL